MEQLPPPEGEFHHFQLVNNDGEIPLSISVLVHFNPRIAQNMQFKNVPITAEEVIIFHDELKDFDGNFIDAFKHQKA